MLLIDSIYFAKSKRVACRNKNSEKTSAFTVVNKLVQWKTVCKLNEQEILQFLQDYLREKKTLGDVTLHLHERKPIV